MSSINKNGPVFWTAAVGVVVLDVLTKMLAVARLTEHVPRNIVGNVVRFTLAFNPGAAFSMSLGENSRYIFGAFAVCALFILWRLYRSSLPGDSLRVLALGLAWGGAAGNLIDRFHRSQGVVDFIDIGDRRRALLDLQRRRLRGHRGRPDVGVGPVARGSTIPGDRGGRGGSAGRGDRLNGRGARGRLDMSTHDLIAPDDAPRLDLLVAAQLELSRNQAATLIAEGRVIVEGRRERASYKPRPGERIVVDIPPPVGRDVLPEDIPLAIAYEDDDVLVVDKPAGMVVHPAPGNWTGTLVNALKGRGGELSQRRRTRAGRASSIAWTRRRPAFCWWQKPTGRTGCSGRQFRRGR